MSTLTFALSAVLGEDAIRDGEELALALRNVAVEVGEIAHPQRGHSGWVKSPVGDIAGHWMVTENPTPVVHPEISSPDSASHFLCDNGAVITGHALTTHYIHRGACLHCRRGDAEIRRAAGL